MAFNYPEQFRKMGHPEDEGLFFIPVGGNMYKVIASHSEGWEHVSISNANVSFLPNWEVMCFMKGLFWDEEDMVIQYHPPASNYVNVHPGVLHLWRKAGTNDFVETPPIWMV